MGSAVAVVTDSTAYLPAGLAERHGLTVVPLQITVGGAARDEGDISTAEAARALKEWHPVTTSRPSPERFAHAYQAAADSGAREVVSVHLSAAMSGTVEAARLAAGDAPVPVRVVDSGTLGMGLGFAALSAAATVMSGGTGEEAAASRAESLAARLRGRIPYVQDVYVGEVGPVIGAHAGPGMLGVVVAAHLRSAAPQR